MNETKNRNKHYYNKNDNIKCIRYVSGTMAHI